MEHQFIRSYPEFIKDKFIGYTPSFIHSTIDSLKEIRDEKKSSWTGRIVSEIESWVYAKTLSIWLLSFACIVEFSKELQSIQDLIQQLQNESTISGFPCITIQGTLSTLNNALAEKMNSFAGRVVCEITTWDDNNVVAKTVREWLLSFSCFSEIADEIKALQDLTAQFKSDEVFADNFWKLKPFDDSPEGLKNLQNFKSDNICFQAFEDFEKDAESEDLLKIILSPLELNYFFQRTLNYPEEQIKLLQKCPLNARSIIFSKDLRAQDGSLHPSDADIHYPALAKETIKFLMDNQPSVWTVVICAHHQPKLIDHLKNYSVKELLALSESINFFHQTNKKERHFCDQTFLKMAYSACSKENINEFITFLLRHEPLVFSDILKMALQEHTFSDDDLLQFASHSIQTTHIILKVFPLFILNLSDDFQKKGSQNLSPEGLLAIITQNLQILPYIPLKTALLALQIQIEKKEVPCTELISHIVNKLASDDVIALLRGNKINLLQAISYLIETHHLLDIFTNLQLAFALITNFSEEVKSKIVEKINVSEFEGDVEILKEICEAYKAFPNTLYLALNALTFPPLSWEIINWLLKADNKSPHHLRHSKEILKTLIQSAHSFQITENPAPLQQWGEVGVLLWFVSANQQTVFPIMPEWAKKDLYSDLQSCASLVNPLTNPVRLRQICKALELDDNQIARFETYFMRQKNPKKFEYAMTKPKHLRGFFRDHVLPNFVFNPPQYEHGGALGNLAIDYIHENINLKDYYGYSTKVEVKEGFKTAHLPLEIFLSIFQFCDPYDILRIAPACTLFYNRICRENNALFWQPQGFSSVGSLPYMDNFAHQARSIFNRFSIEKGVLEHKIKVLLEKPISENKLGNVDPLIPLIQKSDELRKEINHLTGRLFPLLMMVWPQNFYRALSKRKLYTEVLAPLSTPSPIEIPVFQTGIHPDFQAKNHLDLKFLELFAYLENFNHENFFSLWIFLRHNPKYFAYINWILIPKGPSRLGMPFEALKPFCEGIKKSLNDDINHADTIKSRVRNILNLAVIEHPCFDFEAALTTPIFNALT